MIIFFDGTPGSGKSYEAVKKIIDNLRCGRVVYTNIDGMDDKKCQEAIKAIYNINDFAFFKNLRILKTDEISNFWLTVEEGSLIVIDEAHKYFNVREWQSAKNNEFAVWASTHRHRGFDLVLVTVDISRVDSSVRQLSEWTYRFKKANFFGSLIQKKYLCFAYVGDDKDGKPLSTSVRTYDRKIFACYKSYVSKDIKELGIMGHANVFKHPVFYAIPVVIGLFIFLFLRSGMSKGDLFGSNKMLAKANKIENRVSTTPAGIHKEVEQIKKPQIIRPPVGRGFDRSSNGVMMSKPSFNFDAGGSVRDLKTDVSVTVGVIDGVKIIKSVGRYHREK